MEDEQKPDLQQTEPMAPEATAAPEPAADSAARETGNDAGTQASAPIQPSQTGKEMEVHHHVHHEHGAKSHQNGKWQSYIREFLMLFLAVFCGFLAEYKLEHTIARDREKKYIAAMVRDLSEDTANFRRLIADGNFSMATIDSLLQLLQQPTTDSAATGKTYLLARRLTHTVNPYTIFDRTYAQMKSSGNLRLLRDQTIAGYIAGYYADITTLQSQQDYLFNLQLQYMQQVVQVLDPAVFHNMYKQAGLVPGDSTEASIIRYMLKPPAGNPKAPGGTTEARQQFIGTLHYLYARILSTNSNVRNQRVAAGKLMGVLIETYHLTKKDFGMQD
jgi:hypothetical protein